MQIEPMFPLGDLGRFLIILGLVLIFAGLFFVLAGRIPHLGRLPGDIEIHTKQTHFYFPLATSLIISLVLTVIINVIFKNK